MTERNDPVYLPSNTTRQHLPPGATCRVMETRTCPAPYAGPCGDERPCARFESDDPTPWLDTAIPSAPAEHDTATTAEQLALLRQAVLDIDAHATPVGQADPDDPDAGPHHYIVTVGALHRALGKVGHTAPACPAEASVERVRNYLRPHLRAVAVDPADVWNLLNGPQPAAAEPNPTRTEG